MLPVNAERCRESGASTGHDLESVAQEHGRVSQPSGARIINAVRMFEFFEADTAVFAFKNFSTIATNILYHK